jgi:hypothetical protein
VTLEHGLDVALEQAPGLIGQALRGPIDALIREEIRRVEAEQAAATEQAAAAEQVEGTEQEAGEAAPKDTA